MAKPVSDAFVLRAYPDILQTVSAQSENRILQTPSGEFEAQSLVPYRGIQDIAPRFPLPWSHYVKLLCIDDDNARRFYEHEALRGGWSVRQLKRQIDSQFFQRTLLSKNKAAITRSSAIANDCGGTVYKETGRNKTLTECLESLEGGLREHMKERWGDEFE